MAAKLTEKTVGTVVGDNLLDTTVLIDLSRGDEFIAKYIDELRESNTGLFISTVSAMELIVGCRNKEDVQKAQKLLADFQLLPLTPEISEKAFQLIISFSKSHGLLIPDALIAATALIEKIELITDNIKDFKMIPDLKYSKPGKK
jgi:predicted nucleic acid-binding protein